MQMQTTDQRHQNQTHQTTPQLLTNKHQTTNIELSFTKLTSCAASARRAESAARAASNSAVRARETPKACGSSFSLGPVSALGGVSDGGALRASATPASDDAERETEVSVDLPESSARRASGTRPNTERRANLKPLLCCVGFGRSIVDVLFLE